MNKIYTIAKKICVLINIWRYLPTDKKSLTILNKFIKSLLRTFKDTKELKKYFGVNLRCLMQIGHFYGSMTLRARQIFARIIKIDNEALQKQSQRISDHYKDYSGPRILIVSHEFSLTGAPKAALLLAISLKRIYEKSPLVYSLTDGPIRREFVDSGIEIVTDDIPARTKNIRRILSMFDVVIANSWCFQAFEMLQAVNVPKIWWCHEIFTNVCQYGYVRNFVPHLKAFWAGSPRTMENVAALCPLPDPKLILYGLDKTALIKKKHPKFTFSLFGSLTPRKGQDIFIKAIRKLPAEILAQSKFYIIGKGEENAYHKLIVSEVEKTRADIALLPEMPFEKLLEYYALSDVIVVPSREDPMPIVATYAFMFSIPCICSASTGTAQLVENGENALTFARERYDELAEKMQLLFEDRELYQKISSAAESVYTQHFEMNNFEHRIKEEIDGMAGEKNV